MWIRSGSQDYCSQFFNPFCCRVNLMVPPNGMYVLLSLILGLSKWLTFTNGVFTNMVWLGIPAHYPFYHEKNMTNILDVPRVMKLCGADLTLNQSLCFSLPGPVQKRPAQTHGLVSDISPDKRSFRERKKTSKKIKQTRKNMLLLSLSLAFFPRRQAAPDVACLLSRLQS